MALAQCAAWAGPLGAAAQRRAFGAGDLKIVAARIKSVKSIQKITKAMKMVAASKLKADQRRLHAGTPFAAPVEQLISRLPVDDAAPCKSILLVPISSDKGLCGGVNSVVARQTRGLIASHEASGAAVSILGVGDKIRAALQRVHGSRFDRVVTEVTKVPLNFDTAAVVAERIFQKAPERAALIYNKFKSAIAYDTVCVPLLTASQADAMDKRELDAFEFEPERKDLWPDLLDFYTVATTFRCMLDNVAAEQSARMSAMDSASSNAGDMIGALSLKYNRARQAKITTELVEIISGANAL
eukprot:GHVT01017186.1.p1 GENE.GHVT01017186.1~~GHVT01017186.1.p1  ORF type:complete len:299 (+),score=79.74 GHVT01017186.1:156-1052(+)